jgi:hypothetical protein
MFSDFKKGLMMSFVAVGLLVLPALAKADSGYTPTEYGGNFGLGLEFGQPGDWGISGKIWLDRDNAFAPAVKFNDGGAAILQLDYLWHNFDIITLRDSSGEMPLYIGVGGNLVLQDTVEIAARIPLGISYIFNKRNVPVDIYLQAVPTIWFPNGGQSVFDIYGELGAHYYF